MSDPMRIVSSSVGPDEIDQGHPESRAEGVAVLEFDAFVKARTPALLRLGYLLTGDQYLAEDLVQSALARTLLAWPRLHTSAEAYARTTMYHLQVSWWRRRKVAETLPGELPEPTGADNTADAAFRLSLEPAAVLNCSTGTVKSQTARALSRLRTVAPELSGLYREVRNP